MPELLAFFLGIIVGTAVMALVVMYSVNSKDTSEQVNQLNSDIDRMLKEAELAGSLKYRMRVVNEITQKQMDLVQKAENPSTSASHSHYKNQLTGEIKELEQQKTDIFKSILNDGLDPLVSVLDPSTGEPKQMKMSRALAMQGKHDAIPDGLGHDKTDDADTQTDSNDPRERGHLRLVKDEENSNESKPGNPTLH